MSRRKEFRLPSEIIDGLYIPEYNPEVLDLNTFVDIEENVEDTEPQDISVGQLQRESNGIPIPLTEKEAKLADIKIAQTRERIFSARKQIASLRNRIDKHANLGESGKEISFNVDISKKSALKRAVRKVFGVTTDTITYSMYLAALEAKREMETSESQGYLNGWNNE